MMTTNGLNVPRLGEGGRPGSLKTRRQARHDPRPHRRWVEAQLVRPGDCLLGPLTHEIYAVLATEQSENGWIKLTVHAPSGKIRTWLREPRFDLERA